MKLVRRFAHPLAAIALIGGASLTAHAQIGSGWTAYSPSMRTQLSGSGTYSSSGGVETFRLTSSSNSGTHRAERRVENEWSSGTNQFEGQVRVVSLGGTGISLKQTFQPESGAFLMIAVRSNGELYEVGGGVTLASDVIGSTLRINTISDVSASRTYVYVNGSHRQTRNGGNPPLHDKYGTYRLGSGRGPVTAEWSNIRFWRNGSISGGSVSAPAFNPGGGTYSSAQTVTISTSTSGASIRYTTNGANPTSSSGTVYSGPITISATTDLRAIAYTSSASSSVTSAVYTINPGGGPLFWEAESLSRTTSGVSATNDSDSSASGGVRVTLNATSTGSWVQFTLPGVSAGTYSVRLRYKTHPGRGILQASANGAGFGGTLDQYSSSASYPTATLGTVTFSSSGNQTLRLTVVGQNSSSSGYALSADTIELVASSPPPPTLEFEAEDLSRTTSGVSATNDSDSGASGGVRVTLNATNTGSWMQFTLPGVPAGTYSVQLGYKSHNNRGILQTSVNGSNVGGTLDQYASPSAYPNATLGAVTFSSSGNQTIRFTVVGRNSSSSSYTLSADTITLVGQ